MEAHTPLVTCFQMQATAEEERKAKISHSEAAVAAAERRLSQIEQQNKILHEQLEKMSQQLPAAGKPFLEPKQLSCPL